MTSRSSHVLAMAAPHGRLRQWWLDRPVRAKGMIAVAFPLIALIAVTTASLMLQYNERQERSVAMAASRLSTAAERTLADAVDTETSIRGYAATGKPVFLTPYNLSRKSLPADLATLRTDAIAGNHGNPKFFHIEQSIMDVCGRLRLCSVRRFCSRSKPRQLRRRLQLPLTTTSSLSVRWIKTFAPKSPESVLAVE